MRILKHATIVDHASADALVERAQAGAAPTAFRIWKAGENRADDGSIFFTKESAERLIAEQTSRARVYSIDFDHLSLVTDRPAESGRAAGWHSLEVRDGDGGPELWAVNIDWCADAKAGLEETPPKWRFFSPAFGVDKESVVTTYVNFALCINPLTHDLPSLAARISGEVNMTKQEAAKAYATMASADASDDDKKAAAKMLSDFFSGDSDESEDKDKKKDPPEEEKKAADNCDDKKAAETKDEPEAKAKAESEEKTESKAASVVAGELLKANKRIEALEIEGLLRDRPDISESIRKWCATQESAVVKTFLHAHPKQAAKREEKPTQGGGAGGAPAQLEARDREAMDAQMGIRTHAATLPHRREDGSFVMPVVRPTEALKAHAAKAAQTKGSN